jgi:hypothetical protein
MARGKDKTLIERVEEYVFGPLIPGEVPSPSPQIYYF